MSWFSTQINIEIMVTDRVSRDLSRQSVAR
jgi:hypothetical protein